MYKSSFTLDALHRSLLESEIWLDFHPVLHFVGGAVNLNVSRGEISSARRMRGIFRISEADRKERKKTHEKGLRGVSIPKTFPQDFRRRIIAKKGGFFFSIGMFE